MGVFSLTKPLHQEHEKKNHKKQSYFLCGLWKTFIVKAESILRIRALVLHANELFPLRFSLLFLSTSQVMENKSRNQYPATPWMCCRQHKAEKKKNK